MPGSCADITCWKKSSLFRKQNNGQLFGRSQYILGDSGYQSQHHLVASFKRSETAQEKEEFNKCVAKCRVTNEHCIGVLKSRWHSLREMRVQLNEKEDSAWMIRWIVLCARLHNYVLSQSDVWTEDDEPIILEGEDEHERGYMDTSGQHSLNLPAGSLLQSVVQFSLAFHKEPGGCLYQAFL
jgi:hypothetical protein